MSVFCVDASVWHHDVPKGKYKAFEFRDRKSSKKMHSCLGQYKSCPESVKAEYFSFIPKSAHNIVVDEEEPTAPPGDAAVKILNQKDE